MVEVDVAMQVWSWEGEHPTSKMCALPPPPLLLPQCCHGCDCATFGGCPTFVAECHCRRSRGGGSKKRSSEAMKTAPLPPPAELRSWTRSCQEAFWLKRQSFWKGQPLRKLQVGHYALVVNMFCLVVRNVWLSAMAVSVAGEHRRPYFPTFSPAHL